MLDADLTMAPAGERVTVLTLAGTYRPPLGTVGAALDRAILHHVASATIRAFLAQMARRITGQAAANDAGTGPPPRGPACPSAHPISSTPRKSATWADLLLAAIRLHRAALLLLGRRGFGLGPRLGLGSGLGPGHAADS